MESGLPTLGVPKRPKEADEVPMTGCNILTYYCCFALLVLSIFQHALFPPGRTGPPKPLPALVSTLPADRVYSGPEGDYTATLAALRKDAQAAPSTQLLFLGDSLTESLRGDCTRPECVEELPAVWKEVFAPHQALALGVPGDRTENLLYRLAQGETAGLAPSLTVVEIGTNNLAFGHSAEATAYGIEAVIRSVKEELPYTHVALMLLFPRPKDKGDATPWKEVDVVNELLQERVRGTPRVSIIDCTRPFLKDGAVDTDKLPDGIHPNGEGARAWAKCLNRVMKKYLPRTA